MCAQSDMCLIVSSRPAEPMAGNPSSPTSPQQCSSTLAPPQVCAGLALPALLAHRSCCLPVHQAARHCAHQLVREVIASLSLTRRGCRVPVQLLTLPCCTSILPTVHSAVHRASPHLLPACPCSEAIWWWRNCVMSLLFALEMLVLGVLLLCNTLPLGTSRQEAAAVAAEGLPGAAAPSPAFSVDLQGPG